VVDNVFYFATYWNTHERDRT